MDTFADDSVTDITVVIYTYNRPIYLKRTLTYFDSFGLPLKIIVADSSQREVKKQNEETVHSLKYLQVRLLNSFESEVFPYEKCLGALKQVRTTFVVFSPDDDFLSLEGLNVSLDFLRNNSDYVAAEGKNIFFRYNQKLKWIPGDVFDSIEEDSALLRLQKHTRNYQPTFYAVHYTSFLISLFEEALQSGCIEYPFGEFQPSFSTVIQGKVKRLDIFYGARDHTDEFNRKVPPINLIQKLKDENGFENSYGKYKTVLIKHLAGKEHLAPLEAEKAVNREMDYFFRRQETRSWIQLAKKITPLKLYNSLLYKAYLLAKWQMMALRGKGCEKIKMNTLLGKNKDWETMKKFITK